MDFGPYSPRIVSASPSLSLPTISSGPTRVNVFTHLMTGNRRLIFLSFIAPSCCFWSLSLRQTACNMNDTYIHVYKPFDSVVLGIYDLFELLYSAWNMFDATTTAAEPIDGSVIPDVCYTELFQRRYLFYGKKSHKPLHAFCDIKQKSCLDSRTNILFCFVGQCLLTFIVKIYGYVLIGSMILGNYFYLRHS